MHVSRSIYSGFMLSHNRELSILPKHANAEAATSGNQRFCLCSRLDNDIIEAISPLSSLDVDQLFRALNG